MHRGACLTVDPELFFADSRGVGEALQTTEAKAVCACCPVRLVCLQEAEKRGEPWGVWGGELFADGSIVRQKPRRTPPVRATRDEDAA